MKKMIQRFKKLKNERGLTLVELLAVVVILAIIATIAFVYIGGVIENSKKDAHVANAVQIISAAKLYEASGGELTSNQITSGDLQGADMLQDLIDPWTKEKYDSDDSTATVTKDTSEDGDEYSISFNASEGCNLSNEKELDLLKDGRELCAD